MKNSYDCPRCGEEILVDPNQDAVKCEGCQTQLKVEADAELIDGSWKDRTSLIPIKTA